MLVSSLRAVSAAVLLAASLTAPVVLAGPASATEGCYPNNYGVKYAITSGTTAAAVTHAFDLVLAPGGSYSRTTAVKRVTTVSAGVTIESGTSVSAGKVIAQAEAHENITLQASGSHTRETSYSESVSQKNTTHANKEYIVFHGTVRHYGSFVKKTCSESYVLIKKYGKWRSWTVDVKGTTRCDLAPANSVARRAQNLYCG